MSPDPKLFTRNDTLQIPAMFMPGFRSTVAIQNGVEKNLLFRTWGGIGDQICAEPTLRYALKMYPKCRIALETERPELFAHLKFDRVYPLPHERANHDDYLVFETIVPPNGSNMVWQFFGHLTTNCVDFASLCALRSQLPIAEREVRLPKTKGRLNGYDFECAPIVVHPGRHWPSKTFPKDWWDQVLSELVTQGFKPVIIGADTDDNRGTVDVDTNGCVDIRNKLGILDTVELLRGAKVLLTNDSSPLHMAVDSEAWIGFVATCKHPDMITHWRQRRWGWRMVNHGSGGIWDVLDYCPNKGEEITVENVDPELLRSWLPNPAQFAQWAIDKANSPE